MFHNCFYYYKTCKKEHEIFLLRNICWNTAVKQCLWLAGRCKPCEVKMSYKPEYDQSISSGNFVRPRTGGSAATTTGETQIIGVIFLLSSTTITCYNIHLVSVCVSAHSGHQLVLVSVSIQMFSNLTAPMHFIKSGQLFTVTSQTEHYYFGLP